MKNKNRMNRRDFIRLATASAAAVGVASRLGPKEALAQVPASSPKMPTRPLGRTGYNPCLFSLGGQGLLEQPGHTDEAVAIINRAIDLGVNYCDTSHVYGRGCSEEYYGEVMKTRRNEVYLATKSAMRDYDGAWMALVRSSTKRSSTAVKPTPPSLKQATSRTREVKLQITSDTRSTGVFPIHPRPPRPQGSS